MSRSERIQWWIVAMLVAVASFWPVTSRQDGCECVYYGPLVVEYREVGPRWVGDWSLIWNR